MVILLLLCYHSSHAIDHWVPVAESNHYITVSKIISHIIPDDFLIFHIYYDAMVKLNSNLRKIVMAFHTIITNLINHKAMNSMGMDLNSEI